MLESRFPTVTVVIVTYNAENTIEKCLQSVRTQNYPQDKINIIIVDGSSKDATVSIAKKFGVPVTIVPLRLQNAEYNKGVAVRKAKGEFLLMIDHDNILPHSDWLQKMVQPLLENSSIVAVEPLWYHYDQSFSLLDRYFALFGIGDPLAYYLGKSDHLSYLTNTYNLYGKATDRGMYYEVEFDKDRIPTLGANGFLIRREILVNNARIDEDSFFHIDVNVDLIRKGFNTYAFIKDDIIHLTGYKSITGFLYRRKLYMEQFYIVNKKARRYSIYSPDDKLKLITFVIYAVTFIKPTFDAMRGFLKIHDFSWFLHPLLCFSLVIIYGSVIVKNMYKTYVAAIFEK